MNSGFFRLKLGSQHTCSLGSASLTVAGISIQGLEFAMSGTGSSGKFEN